MSDAAIQRTVIRHALCVCVGGEVIATAGRCCIMATGDAAIHIHDRLYNRAVFIISRIAGYGWVELCFFVVVTAGYDDRQQSEYGKCVFHRMNWKPVANLSKTLSEWRKD